MANEQAAEVLQDVAGKQDNAEELSNAGPKAGEDVDPQANANETDGDKKRTGGYIRKLNKKDEQIDALIEILRKNGIDAGNAQKKEAKETVEEKAPVRPVRPKESDFADYEKFAAARDKYEDALLEYTDKVTDYKLREAEKGRQQKSEQQEIANSWAEKVAEAEKAHPDFVEVAFSADVPMNDAMLHAIVTSDNGTEVAYWLGQNPDEAERISKLNPVASIREIGKIESRLTGTNQTTEKEEEKEPQSVVTSRAPRPPEPVRKARSTDSTELRDELPYKEWVRRRNAQLAAQR